MKITEIALNNVRKFSERARILGLGEGLNVLTAPNERGKSTFFDALHAAFFLSHRSGAKPVQDLKSRVGGDPEVTVGFEIDGVSLQIRKVFSKAKAGGAWLRRDGVLVAQHVEAEEMLARLLGSGQGRGPSGLLWVRQGVVGMEPYGEESDARRDIMQSVAGEVDAMTGGRRMEVALRRCATFLDANLTSRGAKKGSPYQAALDEVVRLGVAKAELVEVVRRLEGDLDQRREVRGQIRDLIDPVAKDAREARLKDAEAAFLAAQETGRKVEAARSAVASLGLRVNEVKRRKERLEEAIEERDQARSAEKDAKTEDDVIVLKISDSTKIEVIRSGIGRVLSKETAVSGAKG
jgi:DNA repair exonuclease SbcCD ATPase subunit